MAQRLQEQPGLRSLALGTKLLKQSRHTPYHRVERRRPSELSRSRSAHDLVQGERIGIGPHLGSCLLYRHVPHVRFDLRVPRDRFHDVHHPLVGLIVGVVNTRPVGTCGDADVEVGKIPVVHAGPMVQAVSDDPDQPIGGTFQDVRDDPAPPP